MPLEEKIIRAIARELFLLDYAEFLQPLGDQQAGRHLQSDDVPQPYMNLAHRLVGAIEAASGDCLLRLFRAAAEADGMACWIGVDVVQPGYAIEFGQALAKMSRGLLAWFDRHARFPLTVPPLRRMLSAEDMLALASRAVSNN